MNEYTFTPGPWTMDEYGNIIAKGRTLRLSGVSMPCGARPHDHKEVHANAQLIAAAPCLLEALRDVLDDWRDGYRTSEVTATIEKAQAAIAKATGETHD